jgi:hypothetical protein
MFIKLFRVSRHFEVWIKKGGLIGGTSSDYLLPSECCVMINVILDCKAQVNKRYVSCFSNNIFL